MTATNYEVLNEQARKYEEARKIFIENDRALAEIEKLMADARRTNSQTKLEIEKMIAETRKISRETNWYPVIAGSALTTAIFGLAKLIL